MVLIVEAVKIQREGWKKAVYILAILILFVSTWIGAFRSAATYVSALLFDTGIADKISEVHVVGTSMLPTIEDGSTVSLNSPQKYGLARGDIVSFMNDETGDYHYIKRIVGLSGEKVSIKNGRVYINGKALDEKYTLNNLPTFGNTYITECEEYTVPKDSFAVFGDNRTVSQDSRVVGFVNRDDIDGVIKTKTEPVFLTTDKEIVIDKKTVDPQKFVDLINRKRKDDKMASLVTHEALNDLAEKRSVEIKNNFADWKKNQKPIENLLDAQGYKFNQVHEFNTFGYLDANDVVEQIMDSYKDKDEFMSSQYTEAGVGVSTVTWGTCTYPVVTVILSWPSVPTFDASVIKSWAGEITATNKILSDLQSWAGSPYKDQEKLRNAISIIAEENQIATRIHAKMVGREWLSNKDYADIKYYDTLVKNGNALLAELFPNVKGMMTDGGKKRRI